MEKLLRKLRAIAALRVLSSELGYSALSSRLGLSKSFISKYVRGYFLPALERSDHVLSSLSGDADRVVASVLKEYGGLYRVSYEKPSIILWFSLEAAELILKASADAILSVEGEGALLACLASSILDKPMAYAYWDRPPAKDCVYEVCKPHGGARDFQFDRVLYLPKSVFKKPHRNVVLVDDIMWSGETLRALYRLSVRIGLQPRAAYLAAVTRRELAESVSRELGLCIKYSVSLEG